MLLNSLFGGDIQGFLFGFLLALPGRLFAISCHEWAHAYSAYRLGDPTAKSMGRMTLDPFKHLDPIGFAMLLCAGFGWAKPVPVNPKNFKKYVRDDIIVSLAGVITNFILAFLFLGVEFLVFDILGFNNDIIFLMVRYTVLINIVLGVFNLIPVPPLDGYHLLRHAMIGHIKPQTLWKLEQYGRYALIIAVLAFSGFIGGLVDIIFNAMGSVWMLLLSPFI